VRNIKFKSNRSELFPQECWNLDISNNFFLQVYEAYIFFKTAVTDGGRNAYSSPTEFSDECPIYVTNSSKCEPLSVKDKLVLRVTLHFEIALPYKTVCSHGDWGEDLYQ
jgi:hypothetical protein